jgi:hypothetical protein
MIQPTLFRTPRPAWDKNMLQKLASIVGSQVNEWCDNDTPLEECILESKRILEYSSNSDGYELARKFEDATFMPDTELVNILDNVSFYRHSITQDFIETWVIENDLKLKHKIGDIIPVFSKKYNKVIDYEIIKLIENRYQYGVWFEECNIKKGEGCRYIDAEELDEYERSI